MPFRLSDLWRRRSSRPHERHDRPTPSPERPRRLGLALSAGGAKGLAHVGVLQVLEENGIEIDAVAGSSMGAYVGSLWACGFSGDDLFDLAAEIHDHRALRSLVDPIIPPLRGVMKGLKAKRHLMRSIGETRFDELTRKLLVSTFDLDTKERLVLREGIIADAVHASCAMPGIVAPVWVHGHRCADGGVVDPLPVGALQKFSEVDVIIAVNVQPTVEEIDRHLVDPNGDAASPVSFFRAFGRRLNRWVNLAAPGNVIDTLRKSIKAAQLRLAEDSAKDATLCLHPKFELSGAWHDYTNFEHYIEAGREVATAHLDDIKRLLNPSTTNEEEKPMVGERVA